LTTFAYTATINDSEMVALDAAIKSYLAICRAKIAAGNNVPYRPHVATLERLMARFVEGAEVMSARGDIWDAYHKAKAKAEREKKEE
jgi:hypothetical protein